MSYDRYMNKPSHYQQLENYYGSNLSARYDNIRADTGLFGLPGWIFHPLESLKCSMAWLKNEVEDYAILPGTIIGGGLIIYYLRKTPRL
jgi:hypothetical protein